MESIEYLFKGGQYVYSNKFPPNFKLLSVFEGIWVVKTQIPNPVRYCEIPSITMWELAFKGESNDAKRRLLKEAELKRFSFY